MIAARAIGAAERALRTATAGPPSACRAAARSSRTS